MPEEQFDPIPISVLRTVTERISPLIQLLEVTLVDGACMIGCLPKGWKWDRRHIPLGFNSEAGMRYGRSYVVYIPIEKIAYVQGIELLQSTAQNTTSLLDYPNPLAATICRHNSLLANSRGYKLSEYFERVLPVAPSLLQGIEFDQDLLLYVDWTYLSQIVRGSLTIEGSIPFFSVQKDLAPSLYDIALAKLRSNEFPLRAGSAVSRHHGEVTIEGHIQVFEEPARTTIEGEECIVVLCRSSNLVLPTLLKLNMIRYPVEFIGYIMSKLCFIGELLPAATLINGVEYRNVLAGRLVGYVT